MGQKGPRGATPSPGGSYSLVKGVSALPLSKDATPGRECAEYFQGSRQADTRCCDSWPTQSTVRHSGTTHSEGRQVPWVSGTPCAETLVPHRRLQHLKPVRDDVQPRGGTHPSATSAGYEGNNEQHYDGLDYSNRNASRGRYAATAVESRLQPLTCAKSLPDKRKYQWSATWFLFKMKFVCAAGSRGGPLTRRERDCEGCAVIGIGCRPYPAAVRLDNGSTYDKAHPHPLELRGIDGLEDLV